MIGDTVRTPAYVEAIEAAVRPGSVVVDLGCGTGFFALVACRAGARRVYAIDEAEIIHFAEKLAVLNGFSDRITFLHGDSRQLQLPERADVIVSDVRGALPLFGQAFPALEDARERFLADGGVMIPQRDVLYAAMVEAEVAYTNITGPWQSGANGLDLSSGLSCELNQTCQAFAKPEQLVTAPQAWCEINYAKKLPPNAEAKLIFRAARSATVHGVLLWFEAELYGTIGFSCAPGVLKTVYSHIFLPWLEPLPVSAGQQIHVELHANLVGSDYVWRWDTLIPAAHGQPERIFHQSTFAGAPFTPDVLRRHAVDYVPVLSETGQAECWLLEAFDGRTPLEEIAENAAERFPNVFRRQEDALRRVTFLAERFSR